VETVLYGGDDDWDKVIGWEVNVQKLCNTFVSHTDDR